MMPRSCERVGNTGGSRSDEEGAALRTTGGRHGPGHFRRRRPAGKERREGAEINEPPMTPARVRSGMTRGEQSAY
ncbi:hypothetical protein MRX96_050442 [Rhipicephalus microplus]